MSRSHVTCLLIVLLAISVWSSSIHVLSPIRTNTVDFGSPNGSMEPTYEEHLPFGIANDDALVSQATAEGWDGDGSESTPYIIEGYNITSMATCISVHHVSLYLVIRDCIFYPFNDMGDTGVIFDNVTNGRIENCTVIGGNFGINLWKSNGSQVIGCNVTYADTGLSVSRSNHVTISECNFTTCSIGLDMAYANYSLASSNTISDCYGAGLYVFTCENTTLDGNYVHGNAEFTASGIYIDEVHNLTVKNNHVYDNYEKGLYVEDSDHSQIYDNAFYNNSRRGISATSSTNLAISNNEVYLNGWWSADMGTEAGLYLTPPLDVFVFGNTIYNNSYRGIYMDGIDEISITGNEIYNNPVTGIYANDSANITLTENHIHHNGWNHTHPDDQGVHTEFCDEWIIQENIISHNSHSGITLGDSYGHLIEDNFFNDSVGYNLHILWSPNSTIRGNHFDTWMSDNIRVTQSDFCNITDNTIKNASHGIHIYWSEQIRVENNIIWGADEYGILLDHTNDSLFLFNDIGWNKLANAAEDESYDNAWYEGSAGNFWHDHVSGDYNITNLSGPIESQDIHASRSLLLVPASPTSYDIGETGNELTFIANARNPSHYEVYFNGSLDSTHSWDGFSIIVDIDGLPGGHNVVTVEAYHYSNNSLTASTPVTVADLIAPEWIVAPSDQEINEGDALSAQFSAYDPSGIDAWWVNDTVNFNISEDGLLTNNTILSIGDYGLRVYVSDRLGNTQDYEIRVRVLFVPPTTTTTTTTTPGTTTTTPPGTTPPPPNGGQMTTVIIIIGGAAVVIIIIIIIIQKRS